jgi:hypothetical protein
MFDSAKKANEIFARSVGFETKSDLIIVGLSYRYN